MKVDKLKWIDHVTNGKEELGQEGDPMQDLCLKTNIEKVVTHRKIKAHQLRSQIKVPYCHH